MTAEALKTRESPIASLPPQRLINAIACPAFRENFSMDSLVVTRPFNQVPMENGARAHVQEGIIKNKSGQDHTVRWTRDRNGSTVQVFTDDGHDELVHLGLRDRANDGTPSSTPPLYLRQIGGLVNEEIPPDAYETGATNWYYASPTYDKPPRGERSAEFSISSCDSATLIRDQLKKNGKKAESLFDRDPEALAEFIRDPFAHIPGEHAPEEEINSWYRSWFQIVNRGLRGKQIPYPGQSSTHGFQGFFEHVVGESVQILKELGYNRLSGVPSYHHVWSLNLEHGFIPENAQVHDQAIEFDRVLKSVPIPTLTDDHPNPATLGETLIRPDGRERTRSPLMSWYALLPFMMVSHPNSHPVININHGVEEKFQHTLWSAQSAFCTPSGIITYPLSPGANLWHSKPIRT